MIHNSCESHDFPITHFHVKLTGGQSTTRHTVSTGAVFDFHLWLLPLVQIQGKPMTFTTLCWLSFLAISEPIRSGAVQKRVRLKSHQLMVCIKEGQTSLVGVSSDVTFGVIQLFSRSA